MYSWALSKFDLDLKYMFNTVLAFRSYNYVLTLLDRTENRDRQRILRSPHSHAATGSDWNWNVRVKLSYLAKYLKCRTQSRTLIKERSIDGFRSIKVKAGRVTKGRQTKASLTTMVLYLVNWRWKLAEQSIRNLVCAAHYVQWSEFCTTQVFLYIVEYPNHEVLLLLSK